MKVFCLTDPVVLLDSAFQFFYLPVNSCHVAYVECGYLPKAENSEIVQRLFEHFTNADDLLKIVYVLWGRIISA